MFSLIWILGKFLSISFLKLRQYFVYICVRQWAGWIVTPLAVGGFKRRLHLVTTQGRTAGHQLWFYHSTSKMATLETSVKLCIMSWPSAREHFIAVLLFYVCVIYVFLLPCARVFSIYMYVYTGCPRRNVPNFGRVFLMLTYTDITQNTYVQSWTVTEIMAREVWNFDRCYSLIDYQIHIETGRNMWSL
jgi:hypothetical protein